MANVVVKLGLDNAIDIPIKTNNSLPYTIFKRSFRLIFAVLIPILLLPLIIYDPTKKSRCAYVLFIMALYWMFDLISISATALLPVALFPLLGVLSTGDACAPYMKATNMMFVGGLLMAIAIESCNLHKRVALKVILFVGTSVKRIMLGIMLVTMFLSMWINNTATAAMMVPIVDAMLEELDELPKADSKESNNNNNNHNHNVDHQNDQKSNDEKQKGFAIVRKALLLSIAYSANIGGTGTLTGTGTNLVLQGIYDELYPESTDLTFSHWFIYAAPGMLICVMCAWILLYLIYIYRNDHAFVESEEKIRSVVETKYKELGSLTFHEKGVLINFILLVLLWFFREPEVFPGWTQLITDDKSVKDATPAILIAIFMFIIPANLEQFHSEKPPKKIKTLLDWETVHKNMPWGIIILLGGGFSLAEGTEKSGLSEWLGDQLSAFDHVSPRVAMIALSLVAGLLTEVTSNVATATVLLPVVNRLAISMEVHPLLLMMPVTICVSFAFMFPVATPPNAIVFQSLGLKTFDMIKPGILMNILCIGIELALINSWGQFVFDLNDFPEWAKPPNSTYSV